MKPRPWTPDQLFYEGSELMRRLAPKRSCNRCRVHLGDLSDVEVNARGNRLKPVDNECPLCLGYHVVFADPAPIEPGARLAAGSPITLKLLCPGTPPGMAVAPCAEWVRCGCLMPAGVDTLSVEWAAFLAHPCPQSPTGEHRHLVDRDEGALPFVGAPQVGTCWNVNKYVDDQRALDEAAEHIVTAGPGMYPVEIEAIDPQTLAFEPVEIRPHRRAEVIPV